MSAELKSYLERAREKKLTDEQIKSNLLAAGWPAEQVTAVLAGNFDLPVPPPPTMAQVDMWTGFLYILFFISLYVLTTSVAGIFHVWVDKVTPLSSQADNSLSPVGSTPIDTPVPSL